MNAHSVLAAAVRAALRPLVRILLRNDVPLGAFVELAKQVYVDVAASEFGFEGRKPTVSRVSLLTGLTRKEVSRLLAVDVPHDVDTTRYHRASRIVTGWVRERAFHDGAGKPAVLPFDGARRSFSALVRRHGADVPARAVFDELEHAGAVERTDDGRVRLLTRAYVPRGDAAEKLVILGTDVSDLISSIDHNLTHDAPHAFFQRKVAYDNLVGDCLPALRARVGRKAQSLLESLDGFMSAHDRDANPDIEGDGRHRAMLGIYYFESPVKLEAPDHA